jgi:Flp pilus assembly protein TadG
MRRLKHPNSDVARPTRGGLAAGAVRRALADRRGATATVFAAALIVILGFVGLGTEVGSWYLGRRAAQNAADAGAIAGALAYSSNADPTAAADTATGQNGFANGAGVTVAVTTGTASGNNPNAPVSVTVSQPVPPMLSSLFAYAGTTVGAQATALVEPIGTACVLALSGQLTISTTALFGCSMGSNLASDTAVTVTGTLSPTSQTATIFAVGGCSGCGTLNNSSGVRPPQLYHPAVKDPYASKVAAVTVPTFSAANCASIPAASVNAPDGSVNTDPGYVSAPTIWLWPYELNGGKAYCNATGSLTVTAASAPVKVKSGTFFFNNASITINGGSVTCMVCSTSTGTLGANFVFTGDTNIGTISITNTSGSTKVSLVALKSNATFAGLSGLLFYGTGIQQASIYAFTGSTIRGGIYFPNATVNYSGGVNVPTTCVTLVAAAVSLDGTAGSAETMSTACTAAFATALGTVYGARIVQ